MTKGNAQQLQCFHNLEPSLSPPIGAGTERITRTMQRFLTAHGDSASTEKLRYATSPVHWMVSF